MSDTDYGIGDGSLTDVERARLRPSVNPAALERWLVASGGESRRAVIAHFATDMTDDDLAEIQRVVGIDDPESEELRAAEEDEPSDPVHERFVSQWVHVVGLVPPDEPELRVLWDAIEPSG
jgi:hypothetical protein